MIYLLIYLTIATTTRLLLNRVPDIEDDAFSPAEIRTILSLVWPLIVIAFLIDSINSD